MTEKYSVAEIIPIQQYTHIARLMTDTSSTVIYDTDYSPRGFSPLTFTGSAEQQDLIVKAISIVDGNTLHMWAIIVPQPSDTSAGTGTTYKVYASMPVTIETGYLTTRVMATKTGSESEH